MGTVGIPRALAYYSYFPFWKTVLEELGMQVVVSGPTTKAVLDKGVSEASNDLCVPVKIYYGHVAQLKNNVDRILVPRLVCVNKLDTFCPKFLGLPDMIKYGMENLPPLLVPRIALPRGYRGSWDLTRLISRTCACRTVTAFKALQRAKQVQADFSRLLLQGWTPPKALALMYGEEKDKPAAEREAGTGTIAVLGYPYSLYDEYFNADLLSVLAGMGIKVLTPEMVSKTALNNKARLLPKQLFWHFSNRVLWAGMYYIARSDINGVIHVSNFACGPDAMVNKLLELEAKKYAKPFLTVTLDEHTGQAGIHTRLEAFVDMVMWRRQKACR